MTTTLFTVILLLSSGAPASRAYLQCNGPTGTVAGSDTTIHVVDPVLIVDSRGATIISHVPPQTLTCFARKDGQGWYGDVELVQGKRVQIIRLKKDIVYGDSEP